MQLICRKYMAYIFYLLINVKVLFVEKKIIANTLYMEILKICYS